MTDSLVVNDETVPTVTTLPTDHGEETSAKPGSSLADSDNGSFNNDAKNSKNSEVDRTKAADEMVDAASGAGMPLDVMLADAPAGVMGRTPHGELVSDDARTSASDGSVVNGKGLADLADDTRNLMKASLTQADSPASESPVDRNDFDKDPMFSYEGSAVEMVKISGMRVESHGKGIEYAEDLSASVLVNTAAKLRLFGQDLTMDTEILFTANSAQPGEVCSARLSKAFKVSVPFSISIYRESC